MTQRPETDERGEQPQDVDRDAAQDPGRGEEVEALRAEIEQLRADMLRERADLENQRKRMARELDQARRFANERLLADLLPLFDAMEAGLATAASNDPLRAGPGRCLRPGAPPGHEHGRGRGHSLRRGVAAVPEGLRPERTPAAPGPGRRRRINPRLWEGPPLWERRKPRKGLNPATQPPIQ